MAKGVNQIGIEYVGKNTSYKAAAEDAARATAELRKKANAEARQMEQQFKKVTMALAKIGGAVVVAKKGFELFSSVMKVSEGGSDKLNEAIGGIKEGYFELTRAFSTGNFSNLFKNLAEGAERGRELTKALDDLADRTAYKSFITAGLREEKAILYETLKNKTLELRERAAVADEIIAIADKIRTK